MVLRVPVYERQISRITPDVSTPQSLQPPEAAFGKDVAEATQRLGETGQKIAGLMVQRAQERQKELMVRDNLNKDTAFGQIMLDYQYNDELDDKGRPKGLLNRKLEQAHGITKEFTQTYSKLRKQLLDSVPDVEQQNALARMLDTRFETIQNRIITHERQQTDESIELSHESNLALQESEAAQIQDSPSLSVAIDKAVATQENLNRFMGYDPETAKVKNGETATKIVKSSISSLILSNPPAALKLLNDMKNKIPADKYTELQKKTETEAIDYDIQRDTSTDPEQSFVYKQLQLEDKGYYNFLSADARTEALERSQLKIGRNRRMSDYLLNKNQNQNEAKMLVDWVDGKLDIGVVKNGLLNNDIHLPFGERMLKKFYSLPPEHTDYRVYNQIRELQNSDIPPEEINRLVIENSEKLNPFDMKDLINKTYSEQDKTRKEKMRYNSSALKIWANKNLYSAQEGEDLSGDIVYDFYQRVDKENAQGKRIDEVAQEIIKDAIKKEHPQTTLMEDVPNFIASRNKIKKTYERESKLKAKGKPIQKPGNIVTGSSGINFDDL